MFGTRLMPGTREPSFISGMNAVPSRGSSESAAASATSEARMVVRALATARRSRARYGFLSMRTNQVSCASSSCGALPCAPPSSWAGCAPATAGAAFDGLGGLTFSRYEDSTGVSVSDSTSEMASAMAMVNASGENILPSMPVSVISGRNTRMITPTPKMTGVATSVTAW